MSANEYRDLRPDLIAWARDLEDDEAALRERGFALIDDAGSLREALELADGDDESMTALQAAQRAIRRDLA